MDEDTKMFAQIIAQGEAVKGKDVLAQLREIAQPDTVTSLKDINNDK